MIEMITSSFLYQLRTTITHPQFGFRLISKFFVATVCLQTNAQGNRSILTNSSNEILTGSAPKTILMAVSDIPNNKIPSLIIKDCSLRCYK